MKLPRIETPRNIFRYFVSLLYQARYFCILARIRKRVRHGHTTKVLFLVNDNSKWNAQSVYDSMSVSPLYDPYIVVCRQIQSEAERKTRTGYEDDCAFFHSRSISFIRGYDPDTSIDLDILSLAPDIVFYMQPWGWIPGKQNIEHVSRSALTAYIPYSMPVINDPNDWNLGFHIKLWRFFLSDEITYSDYKVWMANKAKNCRVTGYPKLDAYIDDRMSDVDRKVIIYAPHHSFTGRLKCATFTWSGKLIMDFVKKNPDYTWTLKPHPRFKYELIKQNILTEQETDVWFSFWTEQDHTAIFTGGNYIPLFQEACLLVTDCVSFIGEFAPSGQPVILLANKNSAGYNTLGQEIIKGYYIVYTPENLVQCMSTLLSGADPLKEVRKKNMHIFGETGTRAADKIIEHVDEVLLR